VAGLGKLLGYSYTDESLSKALQTLSASDSLDFRAFLQPDGTLADSTDDMFFALNSADSGYANGSSVGGLAVGDTGETPAVVATDQLLCELQSVAIEWKSLRQATNCSCAMPFEHHTKKVLISPLTYLLTYLLTTMLVLLCEYCFHLTRVPTPNLPNTYTKFFVIRCILLSSKCTKSIPLCVNVWLQFATQTLTRVLTPNLPNPWGQGPT